MYICSFSKKEARRTGSRKVGALRKFISWKEKKKSGKRNIRDLCSLGFRCIRPEIHRRGVPSIVKCGLSKQWCAAFAEELSDGSKWCFFFWVVYGLFFLPFFFFFLFVFSFFSPLSLPFSFSGGSRGNYLHPSPLEPTDMKEQAPQGCSASTGLWMNSRGRMALQKPKACFSVHFAAINNVSQRRKQKRGWEVGSH